MPPKVTIIGLITIALLMFGMIMYTVLLQQTGVKNPNQDHTSPTVADDTSL